MLGRPQKIRKRKGYKKERPKRRDQRKYNKLVANNGGQENDAPQDPENIGALGP